VAALQPVHALAAKTGAKSNQRVTPSPGNTNKREQEQEPIALLVCVSSGSGITELKNLARDESMVATNQDCAHLNGDLSLRISFLGLDLAVGGGSDTWIAESLVPADFLQRSKKIFRVRGLYNVSQGACTERLRGHLRRFVLAQDDYLGLWKYAADFPSGLKTIQIRHAEIHKNKIGQQHFGLLYRVATVDGLATHV
jgi:hypothetical protein